MARRKTFPSALHAWRPVDDGLDHLMSHVCHNARTPPFPADIELFGNSDDVWATATTSAWE